LPPGTVASNGPAADCVVDKTEDFAAELANPTTDAEEQIFRAQVSSSLRRRSSPTAAFMR
jgi:hypothetical protein